MTDDIEIIQHRVARGIIIEGASGILASDWTNVLNRLDAVEDVAEAVNPYIAPLPEVFYSTASHGVASAANQTYAAMQPNWIIYNPVWMPQSVDINRMGVWVETPQPGSTLTLAIYNRDGSRRQSFGTVSATTQGWKYADIGTPVTVPPGMSYLAVMVNNVAGVNLAFHWARQFLFHDANMYHYAAFVQDSGGTLPTTAQFVYRLDQVPFLSMRVAP